MRGLKPYCAWGTDIFCMASMQLQDQKISHQTLDTPVYLAKMENLAILQSSQLHSLKLRVWTECSTLSLHVSPQGWGAVRGWGGCYCSSTLLPWQRMGTVWLNLKLKNKTKQVFKKNLYFSNTVQYTLKCTHGQEVAAASQGGGLEELASPPRL